MKLMRAALPADILIVENISDEAVPVECDTSQMYQLVVDICTNAGQAILNGGTVDIALDCSEITGVLCFDGTEIDGNYCRLRISDNGVGMDKETQSKIFDPFFTTRAVGQGTGLGLSTVFGIVQSHGGGIKVSSKVDKGTTFDVFLPLSEEPVAVVELPATLDNMQDYSGTEAILFVDDEKSVLESVTRALESGGYKVTAVADGQEALKIFEKDLDHFDLVVTDLTMPKLTGEKFAESLLELRADIPVILCTGHSTSMATESNGAMKIRAILQKPLEPTQLMRVVREVLDKN
jgi:CheY-like chemotaxis protein